MERRPLDRGANAEVPALKPVTGRVLLAEGDPVLGSLYRKALEGGGWTVELVADGESAFESAANSPPDLILLNTLPDVSRRSFLERIRAYEPTSDLAVVLLTDSSGEPDQQLVDELGALAILVKSRATRQQLAETLQTLLETNRRTLQTEQAPPHAGPAAEPA